MNVQVRHSWMISLALGLVLPGVASSSNGTNDSNLTVRVVTANIRFAGDEALGRRWKDRRDRLASLLSRAQPDILGTQEGWPWQQRELADRLPELENANVRPKQDERSMPPSILFSPTRFECLEAGDRWLSNTPEIPGSRFTLSPHPRSMAWAVLRDLRSGASIFVANAHLTHLLPWTRRAQARVVAEQVRALNQNDLPVILLGDFNERPAGGTREVIETRLPELTDPWGRQDHPSLATFNDFGGWLAGGRIDWILVDRRLIVATKAILRGDAEGCEGEGACVSDHYPVIVSIRNAPGADYSQRPNDPGRIIGATR